MKHTYVQIFALILLLGFSLNAQSATFNMDEGRDHGSWASLKLSLGAKRFYRAINSDDYSDMRVMVDFDADKCEPELDIQIDFNRSFSESESLGLREVDVRVDRKSIHESLMQLSTVAGDSTLYGYVLVGDMPRLISEMRLGKTVRFKFEMPDEGSDPLYAELSLDGSQAALDRALALCKRDQPGPEEYFQEDGGTGDESAADYF